MRTENLSGPRNNELVGSGRYTWSNGSSYEGGIFKGLRDGQGTFTCADGTLVGGTIGVPPDSGDLENYFDLNGILNTPTRFVPCQVV